MISHLQKAKTVGYVRLSPWDHKGEKTFQEGVSRIQAAGANTIICDLASGSDSSREGVSILLELVKEGLVKKVITTSWSQLMRSSNLYPAISQIFKSADTKLLLLDQGEVNFDSAGNNLSEILKLIEGDQKEK